MRVDPVNEVDAGADGSCSLTVNGAGTYRALADCKETDGKYKQGIRKEPSNHASESNRATYRYKPVTVYLLTGIPEALYIADI